MIRKICAHYVFPLTYPPVKFGIIVFNENGQIIELIDNKGIFKEVASLEFYDGILIPGFLRSNAETDKILFEEIVTTTRNNAGISLEEALKIAILYKAKLMQLDKTHGSLDKNKCPGINLIANLDFSQMKLNEYSQLRTIIGSCS